MMARIGRHRRMAGTRLEAAGEGEGSALPPGPWPAGACPAAAGRRRGVNQGRGGSRLAGGSVFSGAYGRSAGTGSTVVSGGCLHPSRRFSRRFLGNASLLGG
jgi:hypothetical protein